MLVHQPRTVADNTTISAATGKATIDTRIGTSSGINIVVGHCGQPRCWLCSAFLMFSRSFFVSPGSPAEWRGEGPGLLGCSSATRQLCSVTSWPPCLVPRLGLTRGMCLYLTAVVLWTCSLADTRVYCSFT